MRIQLSKPLKSISELKESIASKFVGDYTIKTYGFDKKSILVGKSSMIGAEITMYDQEVAISYSPPSFLGGLLLSLGFSELVLFLLPWIVKERLNPDASYRKLEKEIGQFLYQRYK